MPPAEFAAEGVYCAGDDCHKVAPKWERPLAEVTPPQSSVTAVWTVKGFGSGKASDGATAPIHFGDTEKHAAKTKEDTEVPEAIAEIIEAPATPRPVKSTQAKPSRAKQNPSGAKTKSSGAKTKSSSAITKSSAIPTAKKSPKPAVVPTKAQTRKARR